ncbi:Uncharacterised protein [Salmonella enterica]|uniref:Uncharacterized protein n=1 Tax=Salmonella enterica TaxID=28901 RepID=A0A379QDP7_SALER|nr:Uncharacterised protein [Salmonella enterica]SUF55094.1 Uncharacterised protein [Salmonella enterica]
MPGQKEANYKENFNNTREKHYQVSRNENNEIFITVHYIMFQ